MHHQDILSHQHVLDSLAERGQTLLQTSPVTHVSRLSDQTKQYKALCDHSQELLQKFERNVAEHQEYQDAQQELQDWLSLQKDKLVASTDVTGDRYAIQNKLDRIQVGTISWYAGTILC